MLPHKLKAFVLYVEGQGYAGECEEITTPKLALLNFEWVSRNHQPKQKAVKLLVLTV